MQHRSEAEEYKIYRHYVFNDGFLIPKSQIEMPLFRYRGNIEYAISEIQSGNVYMAPLYSLNDPFDSSYAQQFDEALESTLPIKHFFYECWFLHNLPWIDEIKMQIETNPEEKVTLNEFGSLVAEIVDRAGGSISEKWICEEYYKHCPIIEAREYGRVASFSETWNSIPMWAYYANSHKGVCVKYDFSLLEKNNIEQQNIVRSLSKVWYSSSRPNDKYGLYSPFVKSLQWAHEQEWRLFQTGGSDFVYLPCITEVYLGYNMEVDSRDRILEAVRNATQKITPYMLFPKPDEYSFQKVPINMKR